VTHPQELQIWKVELLDKSYKTYRLKNGGDPLQFPVRVWFTRNVDKFELVELANHGLDIEVSATDTLQAEILTTANSITQEIETINSELASVVSDAKLARAESERVEAEAKAEDEHIGRLVSQINLKLSPQ